MGGHSEQVGQDVVRGKHCLGSGPTVPGWGETAARASGARPEEGLGPREYVHILRPLALPLHLRGTNRFTAKQK